MTTAPASPPHDDDITIATCNVEKNGFGNPDLRRAAYALLREHNVDLIFRQEMFKATEAQHAVMYEAERALGMRGWLGSGPTNNPTAVFANTDLFRPLGNWPAPWDGFKMPPTAVTLQLRDAGPDSTPIIAVAAHLNYASYALREIEAGWITYFNDKTVTLPNGQTRHARMLAGLDGNSYPTTTPGVADIRLPELDKIPDLPHRAHRSRPGPDSTRVMDQEPHKLLHTGGCRDIALHLARTVHRPLAPTMLACDTHGPDARVDWLLSSPELLPAFHSVTTVDTQHLSDHNLVIARANRGALARLLSATE
ncbi:hypothetical protein [Actinacidiphila sp. bgisy144]|uniref:hypothetical protein n=1 Tax=Actinacidiphila sp. bgisy144 TaxID=3413791 RepID=UPI003EB9B479